MGSRFLVLSCFALSLLCGPVAAEIRGGNTGLWGNACVRTDDQVTLDAMIYPPQGDVDQYLNDNHLAEVKSVIGTTQCAMATAVFPGNTPLTRPLKTPWGCFLIHEKPGNNKILFVPMASHKEWSSFVAASTSYLKNVVEVVPCNASDFIPPPEPPAPTSCGLTEPRVVFVLDSSGSIGASGQFAKETNLVDLTVNAMAPAGAKSTTFGGGTEVDGVLTPLANAEEFGWVTFASTIKQSSAASQFLANGADPQNLVGTIPTTTSGNTSLGNGLIKGAAMLNAMPGSGPKVLVLISDGYNNQTPDPVNTATAIRSSGISIVAVGVGGMYNGKLSINYSLLTEITGDPLKVLPLEFDQLVDYAGNLATKICN